MTRTKFSPTDIDLSIGASIQSRGAKVIAGGDSALVKGAAQVPGFAGIHLGSDGELVISLVDTLQAAAAVTFIRDVAPRVAQGRQVKIRRVSYQADLLTEWRSRIPAISRSVDEVNTVGIDIVANAVVVGISNLSAGSRVRELAAAAGIPADALRLYEVQIDPVPIATCNVTIEDCEDGDVGGGTPSAFGRLDEYANVLRSGFMIYTPVAYHGFAGNCTLGPIGRGRTGTSIAGEYFALTSSHCTRSTNINHTEFRQPDANSGTIGYEIVDLVPWYTEPSGGRTCWLSGGRCRDSDAVLIRLNNSRFAHHGRIAHPVAAGGTLELRPSSSDISVISAGTGRVWPGEAVSFVGSKSGLQHGFAAAHCDDLKVPDGPNDHYWAICTAVTYMDAVQGDSGSPVFCPDKSGRGGYDSKQMYGVVAATGTYNGRRAIWYSPMIAIDTDIRNANYWQYTSDIQWGVVE